MNEPASENAGSDSLPPGAATWSVFISYSRKDSDVAERVEAALGRAGVKTWRDKGDIVAGENFVNRIGAGLSGSNTFVLLISRDAVNSEWVTSEYSTALVLSNEPGNPLVIIPVLIKDATEEDIPSLLISTQSVDLRDESKFDDGIKELIQGVKREPVSTFRPSGPARAEYPFLKQISFLGFFPEGLLTPAFGAIVLHLKIENEVAGARKEGVILDKEIDDIALVTAAAGMIKTLFDQISDKQTLAREMMTIIDGWLDDTQLFESIRRSVGFGRSLLVRDLLILSGYLPDDGKDAESGIRISDLARRLLPQIIEENVRIAAEISKSLMEATGFTSADYLMHARLLLGLGLTEQALQIFDAYGSSDLFAEAGLDPGTRIFTIQDWAKAVKDSGRAARLHEKLIGAYEQLLLDVEAMAIDAENPEQLEELKADILNDRATQLAVYGERSDWAEVQADIAEAAATYRKLGLNGKLLASQANFVSHWLDQFKHSGEAPSKAKLQELQDSLNSLDGIARQTRPDENLFFFLYQKARLVKRLYPQNQKRAIDAYKLAADVAGPEETPALPNRYPIALRWVLKLGHQELLISEADYLHKLSECANLLRQSPEDAWAVHALYAALLDLTMMLRTQTGAHNVQKAWHTARETFAVAAGLVKRSGSSSEQLRLVRILKLMSDLNRDEDFQTSFLREKATNQLLVRLVNAPAFRQLNWEDIRNWLKEQEE